MNKYIEKYIENKTYLVWGLFLFIGVAFILLPYLMTHFSFGYSLDENASNIGEAFGGITGTIIAFIGTILTFLAFYMQYKANQIQIDNFNLQKSVNEQQHHNFELQQVETNFFNLIMLHRQNVEEMELKNKKKRTVFIILRAEFQDIYETVKRYYKKPDNFNRHKANITFIFFFYGTGETTSSIIKNILFPQYGEELINKIYSEILKKQKTGYKSQKYLGKFFLEENTPYFPFNGHQAKLTHYFNHIILILKFVERLNILSETEKEKYITVLRAQLSTHEMAIIFFCSLSSIGHRFIEKTYQSDKFSSPCNLITKYQLIKGLPMKPFTYELDANDFYPEIDYYSKHYFSLKEDE